MVETEIMLNGVIHEDLLIHVVKQDVNRWLLLGGGRGRGWGTDDDNVQLGGVAEEGVLVVMARGGEWVALPVE